VAIKGKRRDSKDENDTDTEKPTKSLFENIMDKLLAGTGLGVAATMLKGLAGPALLAGGLLWAAIDGIRGWLKSDEWGVSKIAGALGGALGGMKEGLDGALANAGKGAMIGSGIGMMIGGPLGLIIGALIGTAVGGILGYIGGKNLAKGFDAFAKWFDEHIINGLFGGMEIIKEKLANVGSFFTEKVGPFLKDVFLNGLEYIEQTLLPAIKNLFEALVPVVKALWWVVENVVWPVVKWLGRGILEVAKKGVASFLDSLTFLINWFVAFGEQTGIVANWLYEKFLTFKDGFIKFGEAVGEGAAIIVDWLTEKIKLVWNFIKQPFIDITNLLKNLVDDPLKTIQDLWNNMITTFTSGFKVLFDWIANLGTILKDSIISLLPERLQNWIKEDKKSNSEKNLSPNNVVTNKGINNIKPVVQTKFNWVADSGNMIRFQSAKDDKEYKMARGTLNAKPDDMLGKTFQSIDKQLIALNTLTQKTMHKLDEHSEIFKSLLKVNQQQLGILPALAPQPMVQPKQFISNEKNDRIHEMRQQYRPNIWKDL
jgi:phage-related protein